MEFRYLSRLLIDSGILFLLSGSRYLAIKPKFTEEASDDCKNPKSTFVKPMKNSEKPVIPVIRKNSSIDKETMRKLQNIAASKRYMVNKKSKERSQQLEIENLMSKNTKLKSQVNALELKIETIKTLMKEFSELK